MNDFHNSGKSISENDIWNINYKINRYENIFNITQSKKIIKLLTKIVSKNNSKILIPGCGNQNFLQNHLAKVQKLNSIIFCTDWSIEAIYQAVKNNCFNNIFYITCDNKFIPFADNFFDYIIISNSIISNKNKDNNKILSECYRVLKKNGVLHGIFPSIMSSLDQSINCLKLRHWQHDGTIDINQSLFHEKKQNVKQLFYTPLTLRKMLNDLLFKIDKFEIIFLDTDLLLDESEKIYNIEKTLDLPVWELLITAWK